MKAAIRRIILVILIAACICGGLWLQSRLVEKKAAVSSAEALAAEELSKAQNAADALETECSAAEAEIEKQKAEVDSLKEEATAIQMEVSALTSEAETARAYSDSGIEDFEYYNAVYEAVKEGMKRVESYLEGN